MHAFVTSKNVKWCHLIWPTLYILSFVWGLWSVCLLSRRRVAYIQSVWQLPADLHTNNCETVKILDELNETRKPSCRWQNPRDAKACQKLLQFDVLTTSSLTILVYLHSFSYCCVRNLRNLKIQIIEFKVIQGHRSWCQSKSHMQLPVSHK